MRSKYFILFCFILFIFPLNVTAFSLIDWIKGLFNLSKNGSPVPYESSNPKTSNGFGNRPMTMKRSGNSDSESWDANQIPVTCDEDAILLPLARLKAISPEKIIELLTEPSLEFTCERVNNTVDRVNGAIAACEHFPTNHLYKKLCDGLEYFSSTICVEPQDDASKRKKTLALLEHCECYIELQDDIIDCEGPPDWFEKKNVSAACQFYNDIVDCNYIKAAMLCGKDAAKLLRDFSNSVMRKVLTFPCKISSTEPHVDENLVALACRLQTCRQTYVSYIIFWIFILFAYVL